jgi:type IV pilus assembly protein PilB
MSTVASAARQLADVLLEEQLISAEDLRRAQETQQLAGKSLGRVLIEMGLFTEAGLVAALAKHLGLEFVDLADRPIDPIAGGLVSEALCRRYGIIPLAIDAAGVVILAMTDPANVVALDDVRSVTGRAVRPVIATRADIVAAIDRMARMSSSVEDIADEMHGGDDEAFEIAGLQTAVDDAPIVRFVNALINQAVADRASDIHIEPQEHDLRVRYRVDGVLHEITTQHRKVTAAIVSRLKIMADLDIAERRIPQDGRISIKAGGKPVDIRMSTLPTVYGEKVVMRILDKSSIMLELSDLGFLEHNYDRFERGFRKPYGMILVTGPTGSGKSTTLYATLNVINRPEVNIVTVEDPVEYRLAGVNQVQVNPKAGLTFAGALRSILRQDPDVVLVGEMRDHETAQIGMEAALTGHMVLSTLHTNDAPSAVTRLAEMGIDPFLVGSAVDVVVAQRLARKLCTKCKAPHQPDPAELVAAGLPLTAQDSLPTLYTAVGCSACARTGYRGRLAVHEVMTVSEEIERMIVQRASTDDIAHAAREQGMRSLREDGLAKVLMGLTTLEEVARVVA